MLFPYVDLWTIYTFLQLVEKFYAEKRILLKILFKNNLSLFIYNCQPTKRASSATAKMDEQEYQNPLTKQYTLHYNRSDIIQMVMLKNIDLMTYLDRTQSNNDGRNIFPNYYVMNQVDLAHRQKMVLILMLGSQDRGDYMVQQFCRLARKYNPNQENNIVKFQEKFSQSGNSQEKDILLWYTAENFFHHLLNSLLRAGKDSTELLYAQHFVKLLSNMIKSVYKKQKQKQVKQISGRFVCYRGGYFSQEEIQELQKNIGRHIETLGFLSTTTSKSVAQGFITNVLVEIEVPDQPRDEELDTGYAYLIEEYSNNPHQKQILFNVLSSFEVKGVHKCQQNDIQFWRVQLRYGVTYQMMKKYKQNKLIAQRGPAEKQQILALLSHQAMFESVRNQEYCLLQQDAIDEFLWMMKTKIGLCRGVPELQEQEQTIQMLLYCELTSNQKLKGKQQQFVDQMQQKLTQTNQISKKQPLLFQKQLLNLSQIFIEIKRYCVNSHYEQGKQFILKYQLQKQQLQSHPDFLQKIVSNPELSLFLQQMQTSVSVYQSISNMHIQHKNGQTQKLAQAYQTSKQLLNNLLHSEGRYNDLYGLLNWKCIYFGRQMGLISYEQFLDQMEQDTIRQSGRQANQTNQFLGKLIRVLKEVNQYIKNKLWVQAVEVCVLFRNQYFAGRQHQDHACFKSIIAHLNKPTTTASEKIKILEVCLSFRLPQLSSFYKIVFQAWVQCKTKQKQTQIAYVQEVTKGFSMSPQDLRNYLLQQPLEKVINHYFAKDSMLRITHQCLITKTTKMLGRYEDAYIHYYKLKQQILAGKHPQYYNHLNLRQFEEDLDQINQYQSNL